MRRCHFLLLVVGILLAAAIGVPLRSGARDNDPDAAIAALETRVAALETAVASLQTETSEANEPALPPPPCAARSEPVQSEPAQACGDAEPSPEAPEDRSGAAQVEFDTVLFEADADGGLEEWAGEGWTFREGVLHYDGSGNSWRLAPDDLGNLTNYAVEAEIQVIADCGIASCTEYSILIRAQRTDPRWACFSCFYSEAAAWLGSPEGERWLGERDFALDAYWHTYWHTYRVEVRGNTIRLLVDGLLVLEGTDDRLVSDPGGQVGVWSNEVEINIRRLTVLTAADAP
ncbi:MAG: hypothetical protein ACRDJH_00610 [Thermomicrobiales bacterium]